MISKISSLLEFLGAINFAFVIADSFNIEILNLRSINPKEIKTSLKTLKKKYIEYENICKKNNTDYSLLKDQTESIIMLNKMSLNRILKLTSFKSLSLLCGIHCIFYLGLLGFEDYFQPEYIKSLIFFYSIFITLFMLFFLSIESTDDTQKLKTVAAPISFLSSIIIGVLCAFFFKFDNFREFYYLSMVALIPITPMSFYLINGVFFKQKQLIILEHSISKQWLNIHNETIILRNK